MIDISWYTDLEYQVYSIIKVRAENVLKTKYPNIKFTTTDSASGTSKFPCVYVHMIPGNQVAEDLAGDFNGIRLAFQIEVYSDDSQAVAKEVMDVVLAILIEMKFAIVNSPEFKNETSIYRQLTTVRRIFCSGDSLT